MDIKDKLLTPLDIRFTILHFAVVVCLIVIIVFYGVQAYESYADLYTNLHEKHVELYTKYAELYVECVNLNGEK